MGILSLFTMPIILVVIIIMIIAVVNGTKTKSEKEVNDMLRNIYVYIVLFVTLMMTIGGSVGAFMALSDIIVPAPYYESFDNYKNRFGIDFKENETSDEKLSDEELLKRWERERDREIENKVLQGKNNLLKSLGWVIIPFPIFIYYQRRLTNKANE